MALISSLLALRHNNRILKLPPYLSVTLTIIGVTWLLLLPLNEYSRNTYVSENALLPGQVHTYFEGSEHNVFRAYRHEVFHLVERTIAERSEGLEAMFREQNLKAATQKYNYTVSGHTIANENVYAILQGPRADATEAIVLIGAFRNTENEVNNSGVALILSLARYFKRWSLWSKDIIFLIPGDSTYGPQAWVDAYHNEHDGRYVQGLKIKSGALQGAVAIDYPAGPWGHRYDKLHILYDGINGQLPNLDLLNTAVQIASGQVGIDCVIQNMFKNDDGYRDRLMVMLRGMLLQGLGHATGPHSSFIPYHIDAITLATVGDGWHDEMSLGRTIESLVRSLNNILEHLHQSFFFYLLLNSKRFVSIGTYLPSAMLIAVSFSITALSLWFKSGRPSSKSCHLVSPKPKAKGPEEKGFEKDKGGVVKKNGGMENKIESSSMTIVKDGEDIAVVSTDALAVTERHLFVPLSLITAVHFFGVIPLFLFNYWPADGLRTLYIVTANVSSVLPLVVASLLNFTEAITQQNIILLQSFSLLFLGMFLAALATLNFSLSFLVGVLLAPLSFVKRVESTSLTCIQLLALAALNPLIAIQFGTWLMGGDVTELLIKAAQGWHIWGQRTQLVVWLVWYPAWAVANLVVAASTLGS